MVEQLGDLDGLPRFQLQLSALDLEFVNTQRWLAGLPPLAVEHPPARTGPLLPPMDTAQLLMALNRARHRSLAVQLRSGVLYVDAVCTSVQITYSWTGKQVRFTVRVPTPEGEKVLRLAGEVVHDAFLEEEAIEADAPIKNARISH